MKEPSVPRTEIASGLCRYGFLSHWVERLFFLLEMLPLQRLFGLQPRDVFYRGLTGKSAAERARLVEVAVRKSDRYVLTFVLLECMACLLAQAEPTYWAWSSGTTQAYSPVLVLLCGYRIIDIVQNSVNMLIFSPIRSPEEKRVASGIRVLILMILGYLEMIVCFSLLYFTYPTKLAFERPEPLNFFNFLYFSAATQMTIGYGDIAPLGWLRLVASLQGLIGFLFTVVIVARLTSLLPKVTTESD